MIFYRDLQKTRLGKFNFSKNSFFQAVADVVLPALEIYHYSLKELTDAIDDPSTSAEYQSYLISALDKFMDILSGGEQMVRTMFY